MHLLTPIAGECNAILYFVVVSLFFFVPFNISAGDYIYTDTTVKAAYVLNIIGFIDSLKERKEIERLRETFQKEKGDLEKEILELKIKRKKYLDDTHKRRQASTGTNQI